MSPARHGSFRWASRPARRPEWAVTVDCRPKRTHGRRRAFDRSWVAICHCGRPPRDWPPGWGPPRKRPIAEDPKCHPLAFLSGIQKNGAAWVLRGAASLTDAYRIAHGLRETWPAPKRYSRWGGSAPPPYGLPAGWERVTPAPAAPPDRFSRPGRAVPPPHGSGAGEDRVCFHGSLAGWSGRARPRRTAPHDRPYAHHATFEVWKAAAAETNGPPFTHVWPKMGFWWGWPRSLEPLRHQTKGPSPIPAAASNGKGVGSRSADRATLEVWGGPSRRPTCLCPRSRRRNPAPFSGKAG